MTDDETLLAAYRMGVEHAQEAFEGSMGYIHQVMPRMGSERLRSLLRAKEREEAFDRVLDNPLEVQ